MSDRYDQYIETDSEEEPVLDEHIGVATLAECALILTLGPVCGLAGISKLRKNVSTISCTVKIHTCTYLLAHITNHVIVL